MDPMLNRSEILRELDRSSEEQLADRDLMESFLGDTYGHDDEHFAGVQKFAAQQGSR